MNSDYSDIPSFKPLKTATSKSTKNRNKIRISKIMTKPNPRNKTQTSNFYSSSLPTTASKQKRDTSYQDASEVIETLKTISDTTFTPLGTQRLADAPDCSSEEDRPDRKFIRINDRYVKKSLYPDGFDFGLIRHRLSEGGTELINYNNEVLDSHLVDESKYKMPKPFNI